MASYIQGSAKSYDHLLEPRSSFTMETNSGREDSLRLAVTSALAAKGRTRIRAFFGGA